MKASIPIKISAASSPESEDPITQTSSSLSKSLSSRSFHSSQSIGDGRKKINLVWDTLTPSTSTDSLDVTEKWKTLGRWKILSYKKNLTLFEFLSLRFVYSKT